MVEAIVGPSVTGRCGVAPLALGRCAKFREEESVDRVIYREHGEIDVNHAIAIKTAYP